MIKKKNGWMERIAGREGSEKQEGKEKQNGKKHR